MTDTMPEKLDLATTPISDEKLTQLRQLFSEAFTEGKIDFDALRRSLGEAVDTDPASERFGLRWPGKSKLQQVINEPSVGTLVPQPGESVDWDTTQNLIIEGDNLEVLKLLQKSYAGKVKMIYIDPPYNTGNDFVYPDNFTEGLQTYLEFTGQVDGNGRKTQSNTETNGRYHANWLNMMYPRLYLARNLLRDDGVLFISIDDNESHNLKAMLYEVFGEDNFLASIAWKHTEQSKNDERYFSRHHNTILVFRRSDETPAFSFGRQDSDNVAYSNRDSDPRGQWRSGDVRSPNPRPTLKFNIVAPSGSVIEPPANGWRWSESTIKEKIENGEIIFSHDETRIIRKIYLVDQSGRTPENVWSSETAGSTRDANREIRDLFGETAFDTVKPVQLLRRMISLAMANGEGIAMDFFAGSGTTGHAVMKQNAGDGGNRRYIMVQLPEPLDERKTLNEGTVLNDIADICRERVRRAGRKVREDHAEAIAERDLPLDTGFRAYKLAPSNFRPWDGRLGDGATPQQMEMIPSSVADQLRFAADHLRPDATDAAILAELLLKLGIALTAPVTIEQMAGKRFYDVDDGSVLICLDRQITLDVIERMSAKLPAEIICLDAGFPDDQTKVNAGQIILSHARDEETSIQFKVV